MLRVKEVFFTILRIKEIIITAGGENVAPTNIEEEIKSELPEVWTNILTSYKPLKSLHFFTNNENCRELDLLEV